MAESFYQLETSFFDRLLLEDGTGLLVLDSAPVYPPYIPPNMIVRLSGTGVMQVRKSS